MSTSNSNDGPSALDLGLPSNSLAVSRGILWRGFFSFLEEAEHEAALYDNAENTGCGEFHLQGFPVSPVVIAARAHSVGPGQIHLFEPAGMARLDSK